MKKSNHKIAVIIYGPPGVGKGTQAQLLADKLNLFHFDTGKYIREALYDPANNPSDKKNKLIQREQQLNESGKLNTPLWVFNIVKKKINKLNKLNKSVVLSGSPRTISEAFEMENGGLMKLFEKDYGKKNIYIFVLNLSSPESIKRNSHRLVCQECGLGVLGYILKKNKIEITRCPFCGGKLKRRLDDKKEIIVHRLEEYKKQTFPIIKEMEKKKYRVIKIEADQLPYKIHQNILKKIR